MPYRLTDVVVQCYQQSKYFPCPSRATINDIGTFAEDDLPEVVVVGVMSLDTYSLCLGCRRRWSLQLRRSVNALYAARCSPLTTARNHCLTLNVL